MKNLINKVKSYAFWVGLSSAIVVLVQTIGKAIGVSVDGNIIEEIIMSICGILVVLGVVAKDDGSKELGIDSTDDDIK